MKRHKMKNKENITNRNPFIPILRILFLILLMMIIFRFIPIKNNKTNKQSNIITQIEGFEDKRAVYSWSNSNKYSPAIIDEIYSEIELIKVEEVSNKKLLKSLEELKDLEKSTVQEVEALIQGGDLEEAAKLSDNYLKSFPDSVDMQAAKNTINIKYAKANDKAKKIASNIKGSRQTIIFKEANLRESPTSQSKVLDTLKRGTSVYIYDTKIEFPDTIWCQIKIYNYTYSLVGWVSYETME